MQYQSLGRYQDELRAGITPDLPTKDAPIFVDGGNVYYAEGGFQPFPPQYVLSAKLAVAPVMGMKEAVRGGKRELFWGTPAALYRYLEGSGSSDVSDTGGYTGAADQVGVVPASLWSIESWGQWILATNGVDDPQIFKTTAFAALTGTVFNTAEIFLRYKAFMFAINTDNSSTEIDWCAFDNVEDWVPTATNEARSLTLRDMDSPLMAAKPLGNNIAVYSMGQMQLLAWIDRPNYFGAFPGVSGIGAVGKHAVTDVSGTHYGWGPLGIWKSNGSQYQYIDIPVIRKKITKNLNKDQVSKIVAWHDRVHSLVVFFYPSKNSLINDLAVAYNYAQNHWTIPTFSRSAATDLDVFKFPIFGTSDGSILYMDTEGTDAATLGASLKLPHEMEMTLGFGQSGFGQFGFGGYLHVS